ncbi:MAG: hypothetical protein RIC16_11125 [Rhodospirillales bacterium]
MIPLQSVENCTKVDASSEGKVAEVPDWEAIFEDPEYGVINLIMRSKSPSAIRKSIDLIVSTLFSRAGDKSRRDAFSSLLNDIADVAPDDEGGLDLVRHRMVKLLRGIKEDRVVRARLTESEIDEDAVQGPKGAERRRGEPDIIADATGGSGMSSQWSPTESGHVHAGADGNTFEVVRHDGEAVWNRLKAMPTPVSLEEAFSDVFLASLEERFNVLRGKVTPDNPIGGRVPFLLSKAFAERYVSIVKEEILPVMIARCGRVYEPFAKSKPDKWRTGLADEFVHRDQRLRLWEAWQSAWLELTTQMALPPKPGSGANRPLRKEVRTGDSLPEQTVEEWRKDVSIIKRQNTLAAGVWNRFTAFAEDYHAPLDQDNRLLMELFGRSAGGIVEQIAALLQIALQKDGAPRLFETFQRGKSVDVAMLAACYQYPDVFVLGDRPMLSILVRGFGRRRRLEALPLTSRYLSDRMR